MILLKMMDEILTMIQPLWDQLTITWTVMGILIVPTLYWLIYVPLHLGQDTNDFKRYNIPRKGGERRLKSRRWNMGSSVRYPPPFPNGWYGIGRSGDFHREEVKSVDIFGTKLAVFRSAKGVIHILDAFCPHLGANIGVGGTVRGDCVECPFHHWSFNGITGQCVNIAYNSSDQVPKSAKLKSWTSCEQNGYIFVWYHAECESGWHLPKVDEIDSGEWVYHGGNELFVNCHIQEIPENGADSAHLQAVHGQNIMAGTKLGSQNPFWSLIGHHVWRGTWKQVADEDQKHMAISELSHSIKLFNKFNLGEVHIVAKQMGPAFVQLNLNSSLGSMVILQTVTPLGPLLQKIVHRVYGPRRVFIQAKALVWAETIMIQRDMQMWNNKQYTDTPCLIKDDKFIKGFRQWFKQFYTTNSITYKESLDTLEW